MTSKVYGNREYDSDDPQHVTAGTGQDNMPYLAVNPVQMDNLIDLLERINQQLEYLTGITLGKGERLG